MPRSNNYSPLPFCLQADAASDLHRNRWWTWGATYPLYYQAGKLPPFQIQRPHRDSAPVSSFLLYRDDGTLVGDYTAAVLGQGLSVEEFPSRGHDVIVYGSPLPVFPGQLEGRYHAVLSDGTDTWVSETWTAVYDISPYLTIEWWDDEDYVMDAGTIVYRYAGGTPYRNRVHLKSDIAKPEYLFEEEGENRDGYFFATKQISEKRYRFSFLACEYLLDAMRMIRLSDHVRIIYHGQVFLPDTFLMSPEWEAEGDLAAVDCEFDTDTVAKKVGRIYTVPDGGDYNKDYDNSYDNEE